MEEFQELKKKNAKAEKDLKVSLMTKQSTIDEYIADYDKDQRQKTKEKLDLENELQGILTELKNLQTYFGEVEVEKKRVAEVHAKWEEQRKVRIRCGRFD